MFRGAYPLFLRFSAKNSILLGVSSKYLFVERELYKDTYEYNGQALSMALPAFYNDPTVDAVIKEEVTCALQFAEGHGAVNGRKKHTKKEQRLFKLYDAWLFYYYFSPNSAYKFNHLDIHWVKFVSRNTIFGEINPIFLKDKKISLHEKQQVIRT